MRRFLVLLTHMNMSLMNKPRLSDYWITCLILTSPSEGEIMKGIGSCRSSASSISASTPCMSSMDKTVTIPWSKWNPCTAFSKIYSSCYICQRELCDLGKVDCVFESIWRTSPTRGESSSMSCASQHLGMSMTSKSTSWFRGLAIGRLMSAPDWWHRYSTKVMLSLQTIITPVLSLPTYW